MLAGCAGQLPPSGGPEDKIPPQIVSTYPAPFTTRFADQRIAIEFDEYVEKRSVQESMFISPFVGDLEFDWSGKEVEVRFGEQLRENTTYVITVGTDVVDLRGKNRMAQAFTLAFSTGEHIDRGAIGGRVYPMKEEDKPEGVMIFAYELNGQTADTLNPTTSQPDYVTQTGQNGDFLLRHLRLGNYRILAVRDELRNLLYDPEIDEYAVAPADAFLSESDTARVGFSLRLSKADTTAPRLMKANAPDRTHLIAEFSEPLDTTGYHPGLFQIVDTTNGAPLTVRSVANRLSNPAEVFIVTDEQIQDRPYRLTVSNLKDRRGIVVNPLANSIGFVGSGERDSTGPSVSSFSVRDSARGVVLQPTILAYFSDAVQMEIPTDFVTLSDSTGTTLPLRWRWLNGITLQAQPVRPLSGRIWHTLGADLSRLYDFHGNRGRDTTLLLRFETLDTEQLSGIEGTVTDTTVSDSIGGILVKARNVSTREVMTYEVRLPRPGKFELNEIGEGRYVLEAIRDRNDDGAFTPGNPFPFLPAERFIVHRDTLKVRARWPLDGVRIELR
jgi:hypothetical protein